jgi:hypothetical protein
MIDSFTRTTTHVFIASSVDSGREGETI